MKPIAMMVIGLCAIAIIAITKANASTAHDQYDSVAGEVVCIKGYSYIYAPISDTYVQMFEIVEQARHSKAYAKVLVSLPIKCK